MEYKHIKTLTAKPSLLGFGCMRFPLNGNNEIDEEIAEQMLDKAINEGVNYIDTAYPYHNGTSEPFVGKVIKKYPRNQIYLASKLPIWLAKSREDVKALFEEQLNRLQVDYIDFYLIHALDKEKWQKTLELEVIPFLTEMKQAGKIRYLGFSFHDDYEVFHNILLYHDWDFCQIQLNYMDTQIQAGMKGYQLTNKLDIPLIVMEPIKGGRLVDLPVDLKERLIDYEPSYSIASWALRWVASLPNVKVVLSGMSSMKQVLDNLETFHRFTPLNEKERQLIDETAQALHARVKNGCTGCGYCMPCPFGVDIPANFRIWNEAAVFDHQETAEKQYAALSSKAAQYCQKCGKCEAACPQHIAVRDDLDSVKKELSSFVVNH